MYANTPAATAVLDKMVAYGVRASGEVVSSDYHDGVSYDEEMTLGELVRNGGKISRVRLLTDVWPGRGRIADVSYIHGMLPSGKIVPIRVELEPGIMMRELKGRMIDWAKEHKVFAKGCGLLDESTWSVLY
jgi:hypothetical protein